MRVENCNFLSIDWIKLLEWLFSIFVTVEPQFVLHLDNHTCLQFCKSIWKRFGHIWIQVGLNTRTTVWRLWVVRPRRGSCWGSSPLPTWRWVSGLARGPVSTSGWGAHSPKRTDSTSSSRQWTTSRSVSCVEFLVSFNQTLGCLRKTPTLVGVLRRQPSVWLSETIEFLERQWNTALHCLKPSEFLTY